MRKATAFILVFSLLAPLSYGQDSKPAPKPEAKPAKTYKLRYQWTAGLKQSYDLGAAFDVGNGEVILGCKHKFEETCVAAEGEKVQLEVRSTWVERSNKTGKTVRKGNSDGLEKFGERGKALFTKLMAKRKVSVNSLGHISRSVKVVKRIEENLSRWVMSSVDYAPYDYLKLPEKAVKIGEAWSHKLTKSAEGLQDPAEGPSFITTFHWTLKEVKTVNGEMVATVILKTKTEVKYLGKKPEKQVSLTDEAGQGELQFNMSRGMIEKVQFSQSAKIVEGKVTTPFQYSFSAQLKRPAPKVKLEDKAAKATPLRYQFKAGQKRHYRLKANYDQGGRVNLGSQHKFEEHCQSIDGKTGVATLEVKSPWVERSNKTRGINKKGSSDDFDKMGEDEKKVFLELMAKRTIKVDQRGQASRDGSLVDRLDKQLMRWTVSGIDAAPYDYVVLPEKAVKVGETWTRELKKELSGPFGKSAVAFVTTFTWTFKKLEVLEGKRLATLSLLTKTTLKTAKGKPNVPLALKDAVGKGTVIFDLSGHIQSVQYEQSSIFVEGKREIPLKYAFSAELEKN